MNRYGPLSWYKTAEQCTQIIVLAEDGTNRQDIANCLDLHQSTVSRVLCRSRETVEYCRRPGEGHNNSTKSFSALAVVETQDSASGLQVMTVERCQLQIS
jgi:predicted transcriptional regulator